MKITGLKSITKDQSKDTGMVLILIVFLLILMDKKKTYAEYYQYFIISAFIVLIINMTIPFVFKPLAWLWFSLADIMSSVFSKVLLSIIFFGMILPYSIVLRLLKRDLMKFKLFKKDERSAFVDRNHIYKPDDIKYPY